MKKLSIILGLVLMLGLLSTPAFPISFQFDFYGGDTSYFRGIFEDPPEIILDENDTVMVDVWLTDYKLTDKIKLVGYEFEYDTEKLDIIGAWPCVTTDPEHPGPWGPISYANQNGRYYAVFSPGYPDAGIQVDDEVIMHTMELKWKEGAGGDGLIQTLAGILYVEVYGDPYPVDSASATIHGPCIVSINPSSKDVKSGEPIPFEAMQEGNCNPPSYIWDVTPDCGSSIDASGSYISGDVSSDCSDTVTVTDTANGDVHAKATVNISPWLTIVPQNPTIGAGGSIVFKGVNNGFCDEDPIYTWSVGDEIGSTISEGNTVGAKGKYRAGRNVSQPPACLPTTDTVHLQADCDGVIKTAETKVTVTPCLVTISPKSAELKTGETILFTASGNACCKNDPCYTWEVSAAGATGNTTTATAFTATSSKSKFTWSVTAAGATGNTGNTFSHQFSSDAYCYDGRFCNGFYRCVDGKCQHDGDPCAPDLICDEVNDVCIECLADADCDNGLYCDGTETCEDGVCEPGENPCPPDDKPEKDICVEDEDICVECLTNADCMGSEVCNLEENICMEPIAPLSFTLIPDSALRSHLIPLPLFMLILSDDPGTKFDNTATVRFGGDAVTTPLTLVLAEDLIFSFSLINSAGLGATGNTEVEVTVTTDEGEGTAPLTLMMLPFILGN